MSLLKDIPALREMERAATPRKWICECVGNRKDYEVRGEPDLYILFEDSDKNDPVFITSLRNAAPTMLEVLRKIEKGDAAALIALRTMLLSDNSVVCGMLKYSSGSRAMRALDNAIAAAELMEAEGDEL